MREFKLIVAGGRDFNDYSLLSAAITQLAEKKLSDRAVSIVSGVARGADAIGAHFARENGVVLYEFPADWNTYGKSAGYRRNVQMAEFSDGLLAFWDGNSRGTKHMIETMQDMGKPVWVLDYFGNLKIKPEVVPPVVHAEVTWTRRGGYECSTKGDARFSALSAMLSDGRTIEQHYQCDVKGYQPGGYDWRLGKGKPSLHPVEDLYVEYLSLWKQWAANNPNLIEELRVKAASKGYVLSDCFANTPVNQARALADILNGK